MFEFLEMMDNHKDRTVATFEKDELFVDTCAVTDSDQPYETAIAHPAYNNGKLIIVQMYDTKEEAQKGHDVWVATMTTKKLPRTLRDVSTASIKKFGQMLGVFDKDGDIIEKGE